jgi:hypothetical protein
MYIRAIDPGATAAIADASNGQVVGVRVFTDNPSPEMRAYVATNKPVLWAHGRGTIISRGNALILRAIEFGRQVQKRFASPAGQALDLVVSEKPLLTHNRPVNAAADVVTRGNDLIATAVRLGRLVEASRPLQVCYVTPSQWKGQVPKDIHNARVLAKLRPDELALAEGLDHNGIDALGLLIWALER